MNESFIQLLLQKAKDLGCEYADFRYEETERQNISVKNEQVEALTNGFDKGFGIRVLKKGYFGFSSSASSNEKEAINVLMEAVRIAEASSVIQADPIQLAPSPVNRDKVSAHAKKNPLLVPLNEKIDLLRSASASMKVHNECRIRKASLHSRVQYKQFSSTEGTYIEQDRITTGAGIHVMAFGNQDMQIRSYPNSFGGDFSTFGFEFVEQMKLTENGPIIAEESRELIYAPICEAGEKDIILDGNQLALQVHESIGHPSELDRVFGYEAAYAGTSFLTPDKLFHFQVGSSLVNIVADATIPGTLGGFAYDDEGIPGSRVYLVKEGIFVGYLNSRETCWKIREKPMGSMRADRFSKIPIIRMTSVNLEPGDKTVQELIQGIDDGLWLSGIKSWSIDDRRLNFQFATEIAREIKQGKLGRVVKNPSYIGETPTFWNACDGIANRDFWHVWGVPNCGKGQPAQIMTVSHGTAPARFRKIKVGVAK
ncbi:TldD/PmbA family protein [bacterium]|nr:TldD/PmbA family protein [bacterium]